MCGARSSSSSPCHPRWATTLVCSVQARRAQLALQRARRVAVGIASVLRAIAVGVAPVTPRRRHRSWTATPGPCCHALRQPCRAVRVPGHGTSRTNRPSNRSTRDVKVRVCAAPGACRGLACSCVRAISNAAQAVPVCVHM